jgi:acyl-coenzyme A synthetase/AMP-(fatty) acid ligase
MLVVSLPREATGKVEKRVLKEFVESRLGGEA